MPLTGREKATIFLSILGSETSARVLRYLPDELADLIAAGINHLPSPSPEALSEVIEEFQGFWALPRQAAPAKIAAAPAAPAKPRKNYSMLMYERPQLTAYLIALLPEEEKQDALQSLTRDRAMIEELLLSIKDNPLAPKIKARLKEQFTGRLF